MLFVICLVITASYSVILESRMSWRSSSRMKSCGLLMLMATAGYLLFNRLRAIRLVMYLKATVGFLLEAYHVFNYIVLTRHLKYAFSCVGPCSSL